MDGLDEWVNENAGRVAAAAIETFIAERHLPALVSTRPFGLTRMRLAGEWQRADLAALSTDQQRELARQWFATAYRSGYSIPVADARQQRQTTQGEPGETQADHVVDGFLAEVGRVTELRRLAGVPLFLLALIGLRLAGVRLPNRRFEVYERVVGQLLKDHPASRATAAAVTSGENDLPVEDIRIILAHVAYAHQKRGDFGPVPEETIRRDVIAAFRDPDHLAKDAQSAADAARPFVHIAEGKLGVLVRQGPRELGFLHRVLLEQLAAEHAADRLELDELSELFADRAADPRWKEVLLATLWRLPRPQEVTRMVETLAEQACGSDPAALAARELLAEIVAGGYGLPAPRAGEHASTVLKAIDEQPYLPHRQRLLSAIVPGLNDPAVGTVIQEHLARWTVASQPLPSGVFYRLGQVSPDEVLDQPVWPALIAALLGEDLDVAHTAAWALADRYRTGVQHEQVGQELIACLHRVPTTYHAALVLLSLLLGWPDNGNVAELAAAARRRAVPSLRFIALAAALGVLDKSDTSRTPATDLPPGGPVLRDTEIDWLFDQLGIENWSHKGRRYMVEVLVAATQDRSEIADRVRNQCLAILRKDGVIRGDRAVAWAVLLTGHAEHPDVIAFVCDMLVNDGSYIHFLGTRTLAQAYAEHPQVALAVEKALETKESGHLETELHALAMIDHGPVMRAKLLASLAVSGVPHWAADALVQHWPEDEEVVSALRSALEGDPEHAARLANAAVRTLGPARAIERLLEVLTSLSTGGIQVRRDIVVDALLEACEALKATSGDLAERVATACLSALDNPADNYGADAEGRVVATLPTTTACRTRAQAMLTRPQVPLTALIAGYRTDRAALGPILRRLNEAHPPLPAAARYHLCLLLRDHPSDGPLIRRLSRHWQLESNDLVRSAATVAFHTQLRRDRDEGRVPDGEWDDALQVLRRVAVVQGYEQYPRRSAAWLGALLLDRIDVVGDLVDPYDGHPIRMPIGEQLTEVDVLSLGAIADNWLKLREHFGDVVLERFSGSRIPSQDSDEVWNLLALVANRQSILADELEDAIASRPELLSQDGVLAWYATSHHGEEALLDVLVSKVDADGTNVRSLSTTLIAEPQELGLEPEAVRARLRALLAEHERWLPPYQSGALEALADGFPDDDAVHACWSAFCEQRQQGRVTMHPRTYLPLVYAAVPSSELLKQIISDTAKVASWTNPYFDAQFTRAIVRRLRRDTEARVLVEASVRDPDTQDHWATQLASYLAAAHPLDKDVLTSLAARLEHQQAIAMPDAAVEPGTSDGSPIALVLLGLLDPSSLLEPTVGMA